MTQLKQEVRQIRMALGPQIHDNEAALAAWDALGDNRVRKDQVIAQLKGMIDGSKGSINNSYQKVQIASGVVAGLIALFLSVFAQQPGVIMSLLILAVAMEAASIGVSFLVTTPRSNTLKQVVNSPGAFAAKLTRREEFLSLSRHAHHNRVVLLRNRRVTWLATWVLIVPGLVFAMLAWAWLATCIALVVLAVATWAFKRYIGSPPARSPEYPSL